MPMPNEGRACSICGHVVDPDSVCSWWVPPAAGFDDERWVEMLACYPGCCATFLPADVLQRLEAEALQQSPAFSDELVRRFGEQWAECVKTAGPVLPVVFADEAGVVVRRLELVPRP